MPTWFASLVRPQLVGRAVRVVAAEGSSPVVIVGEPADEIAEAWNDFSSLAIVWLSLDAVILAVLYVVLGRMLDPLASLSRACSTSRRVITRRGSIRRRSRSLPSSPSASTRSRSRSTPRVTRIAASIASSSPCRRRSAATIANELHDEAGPCLFGITANASSIQNLVDQLPDKRTGEISRRVGEILSITERLKVMNRALLKKLRPGPLGRVKLAELLDELIVGFQRRHPGTEVQTSLGKLADSYGESIDLTLYRCIQEGITNAIRHGYAEHLTIDLAEEPAARRNGKRPSAKLALCIGDDGKGIAPETAKGFGLTTMTERVRSLGGSCTIESAPLKGTMLHIEIPVQRASAEKPRIPELVGEMS